MIQELENKKAEIYAELEKMRIGKELAESDIIQFSEVLPVSSREFFGENWYLEVSKQMDPIEMLKSYDKELSGPKLKKKLKSLDALKPDDTILAGINVNQRHPYKNKNLVTINSEKYCGLFRIIKIKDGKFVLNAIYNGTDSGEIINSVMIEKFNKQIESKSKELNKIESDIEIENKKIEEETLKTVASYLKTNLEIQQSKAKIIELQKRRASILKIAACIAFIGIGIVAIAAFTGNSNNSVSVKTNQII